MVNSFADINFKPNYYNFTPAEILKDLENCKKDIPDLGAIFKAKFYAGGKIDIVSACKYSETILGLRMINHDYALHYVEPYILLLLDLNRYEEVFDLCSKLIQVKRLVSAPLLQKYLILSALLLEDPQRIDHLMPETLDQEASTDDWIYYIQYHKLRGTVHSLLDKPLPAKEAALSYLYLVCSEYKKSLLRDFPKGDAAPLQSDKILDLWIVWLTLNKAEEKAYAAKLTFGLMNATSNLNRIIENLVLDEITFHSEYHSQIAGFIEKYREARPFSPKLLYIAARVTPGRAEDFLERAKKIAATFSNPPNKRFLIKSGSANDEVKMVLIAKIATCAFPSLSAISELLQYYKNKKKESLEICQSIERKPLCGALKEQIAMTYASFSESDEECEAALLKIETLINELPRSIALYIGKIGLLITLNRIEEAEQSINRGVELFGYKESFIHLIVALYEEKKKDIDSAIKRLLEFYEKNPSDPCLTALIDCYNRHKSKEEKFLFLCETVFPTTFKLGYESYLSEIKEIFSHLENPREGLERLCSIKRGNNLDFLKIRADFLSEWGEYEKSLEDVDYLCHRQIKSAAISKISLLIQLARYTEAVQLALSLTDIPEITVSRLISALENEDGWAKEILLIGEKFKPKAYDARKSIAFAYVMLEAFDKALPLFNRLKSENNTDTDVLNGRAQCYQGKKQYATAKDQLDEVLELDPKNLLAKTLLKEVISLKEEAIEVKIEKRADKKAILPAKKINPASIPILIESAQEISEAKLAHQERALRVKVKSQPIHLQKASSKAVDPLKDPLADIKAIARKGEKEAVLSEEIKSVPLEKKKQAKIDAPKLLVKTNLKDFERVFLNRSLDALKVTFSMTPAHYDEKIVFNNYIYTILRVFTPIRLNALLPALKDHLKEIRDTARHESDLISFDHLARLFQYLREIRLDEQLSDWINEKSAITKLCLIPHRIQRKVERKPAIERIIIELDFIRKIAVDKERFMGKIYDRNAIKASVSIIGAASKYVSDELKYELSPFREEGNVIAHAFFEEGDTFEYSEKFKEEEITPEALWELTQQGIELYKKLTGAVS